MGFVRDKATGQLKWTNDTVTGKKNAKSTLLGGGTDGNYDASGDDYINQIAKGLGSDYQDLLNANPYANYNYTPSFWDKIGNFLGFNTQEDVLRMQYEQGSRQWASQVASMKQENDYNSPTAQAQRMREAGQNPDLLGTGGVAGGAEMTEPTGPDVSQAATNGQGFGNVVSMVIGAVNQGFDIANKFASIKQMYDNNYWNNMNNVASIAEKMAGTHWGIDGITGKVKPMNKDDYGKLLGIQEKFQPMYRGFNQMFTNSLATLENAYNRGKGVIEGQGNYMQSAYSKYGGYKFGDETDSEQDRAMFAAFKPLIEFGDKHRFNVAKNAIAGDSLFNTKTRKEQNYWDAKNMTTQAEAENATNDRVKQEKTMDKEMNGIIANVIHNLTGEATKGNKWAAAALLVFYGIKQGNASGMLPSMMKH